MWWGNAKDKFLGPKVRVRFQSLAGEPMLFGDRPVKLILRPACKVTEVRRRLLESYPGFEDGGTIVLLDGPRVIAGDQVLGNALDVDAAQPEKMLTLITEAASGDQSGLISFTLQFTEGRESETLRHYSHEWPGSGIQTLDWETSTQPMVMIVREGSPADKAGVQPGWRIVMVNGKSYSERRFVRYRDEAKTGKSTLSLKFIAPEESRSDSSAAKKGNNRRQGTAVVIRSIGGDEVLSGEFCEHDTVADVTNLLRNSGELFRSQTADLLVGGRKIGEGETLGEALNVGTEKFFATLVKRDVKFGKEEILNAIKKGFSTNVGAPQVIQNKAIDEIILPSKRKQEEYSYEELEAAQLRIQQSPDFRELISTRGKIDWAIETLLSKGPEGESKFVEEYRKRIYLKHNER